MRKPRDEKGTPFAMNNDGNLYAAKVFVNICYLQKLSDIYAVTEVKKTEKNKDLQKNTKMGLDGFQNRGGTCRKRRGIDKFSRRGVGKEE